jgi:hypothetical protein
MNIYVDGDGTMHPLFPVCDAMVDSATLGDADRTLVHTDYPDHGALYSDLTVALQRLVSAANCQGIVLNGVDVLYSANLEQPCNREQPFPDIHHQLLSRLIRTGRSAFFDVFLAGGPSSGMAGGTPPVTQPRKYRVHYKADINSFAVSVFGPARR